MPSKMIYLLYVLLLQGCLSFYLSPQSCIQVLFARDQLTYQIEQELLQYDKYDFVIGVDEAGCGAIAGPVVVAAACCLFSQSSCLDTMSNIAPQDSKVLNKEKRESIYSKVLESSDVVFSTKSANNLEIDDQNVLQANLFAMKLCIADLLDKLTINKQYDPTIHRVLAIIDGNKCPANLSIASRPFIRGDSQVYSIALASIIAKVERDQMMNEYDEKYPFYGFGRHKGYPTKHHIQAIHQHGACPIHRMTFKPLKGRTIFIQDLQQSPIIGKDRHDLRLED